MVPQIWFAIENFRMLNNYRRKPRVINASNLQLYWDNQYLLLGLLWKVTTLQLAAKLPNICLHGYWFDFLVGGAGTIVVMETGLHCLTPL